MTITEELAALEAAEKAATPGPWETNKKSYPNSPGLYVHKSPEGGLIADLDPDVPSQVAVRQHIDWHGRPENALFIIAARNALPALLAEIRFLRATIAATAAVLDREGYESHRVALRPDRKLGEP